MCGELHPNIQIDYHTNLCFPQTQWRRYHAISSYKQQKKASLTLQCLWRARVARKELRKLRMVSSQFLSITQEKYIYIVKQYLQLI